jgi:DNA-binding response OmpR family regulator
MQGDLGADNAIEHLGLRLDCARRTAQFNERHLHLTGTEFRLLECLVKAPGQAFSRTALCQAAIAGGAVVLERTIDVHICALRRKLRGSALIQTVRGKGYRCRAG